MTTPEPQRATTRVIGVDVGGTKVAAGVVALDGSIEGRLEQHTEVASEEALLAQLDALVEELRRDAEVAALGFGLPSRIDQRRGRAVASVNVPLTNVDFRDRMRERHGLSVALDNDANAAAIAEWHAGAARGADHVVMLTLGTGVGGGLILGGKPYRGATGSGAELGHIVVELDGLPCRCGGRGHLESYATGLAADRLARDRIGPGSSAHDLVRRAHAGEAEALELLAGVGRYLGAAIASFVNALEPELVVIGGGFGEAAGEFLLASAREVIAQDALPPGRDSLRIVEAQLGGDAGVIGAGMIAFEALAAEA
jgi:glucokinase